MHFSSLCHTLSHHLSFSNKVQDIRKKENDVATENLKKARAKAQQYALSPLTDEQRSKLQKVKDPSKFDKNDTWFWYSYGLSEGLWFQSPIFCFVQFLVNGLNSIMWRSHNL